MSEVKRYAVWASPVSDGPTWVEFTQDLRNNFPDAKGYVREEDFDRVTAERDALQVRVNEWREEFQELSEQSERRGRQASEFEECMGELQVANGRLQDQITLLSGSAITSNLTLRSRRIFCGSGVTPCKPG